jgi:hypothetical protein
MENQMDELKSRDIERMAGVSKIQLVHWINSNAIVPMKDDRRRGGVRYFSRQNLFEAMLCKQLNEWRLPVQTIAGISQHVMLNNFFNQYKKDSNLVKPFLVAAPFRGMKGFSFDPVREKAGKRFSKSLFQKIANTARPQIIAEDEIPNFLKKPTAFAAIIIDLKHIAEKADKAI